MMLLRRLSLAMLGGSMLLGGCLVSAREPVATRQGSGVDAQAAARLVVDDTNAFRRQQGRAALRVEPKLTETAADFAAYLARSGRFGHTADGSEPADRAVAHGYAYCIIAENIGEYRAANLDSRQLATELLAGWQRSPEHRENLLDADITEIGVAIVRNDATGSYVGVQMFGRPKSDSISFTLTNRSDAPIAYRLGDERFTLPPGTVRTHETCGSPSLRFDGAGAARQVRGGERLVVTRGSDGVQRIATE